MFYNSKLTKLAFRFQLILKEAQVQEETSNYAQIVSKLNEMIENLNVAKNNSAPGTAGSIDAAIDQLKNALGQADQAVRDYRNINKPDGIQEALRYMTEVRQYYMAAKSFMKKNPDLLDDRILTNIARAEEKINSAATPTSSDATTTSIPTVNVHDLPNAKPTSDGWYGERIDPVFQIMLGVKADGKLGPQTRAALENYKASENKPGMEDIVAFDYLKHNHSEQYNAQQPLGYDKDLKVYFVNQKPGDSVPGSVGSIPNQSPSIV